jgi:glycosyltransferase involved in cell wall biosynthesis
VLFYGTYIPLQGIDVIVAAAERLRADRSIAFTLVGDGQERARIRALADTLALPNLTFVDRLLPEQLALRIAAADICLGVFDAGIKAGQVVPNKVVQCAAMQKAIITRESPAVAREFQAGLSALLVRPADPAALAEAVASLARDAQRRAALGREARKVFDARFSQLAQTAGMRALLDAAARDR